MNPVINNYDGLDVALVPWICKENEEECMNFIANASAPILMGHLELGGFQYMAGANIKSHGMDKKVFNRYEAVYSGHYHTKSTQENVTYLGTQYELTWSDAGDPKYFHVLNTDTRELTPVKNENGGKKGDLRGVARAHRSARALAAAVRSLASMGRPLPLRANGRASR